MCSLFCCAAWPDDVSWSSFSILCSPVVNKGDGLQIWVAEVNILTFVQLLKKICIHQFVCSPCPSNDIYSHLPQLDFQHVLATRLTLVSPTLLLLCISQQCHQFGYSLFSEFSLDQHSKTRNVINTGVSSFEFPFIKIITFALTLVILSFSFKNETENYIQPSLFSYSSVTTFFIMHKVNVKLTFL